MINRKWARAALAAALVTGGISAGHAWGSSRMNELTFSGSVSLPDAVLPPGTYTFEVLVPGGGHDVVQVRSRTGRAYFLGFTRTVDRPRGARQSSAIAFGEARGGTPPPINVWYPNGLNRGHQFIYPESR